MVAKNAEGGVDSDEILLHRPAARLRPPHHSEASRVNIAISGRHHSTDPQVRSYIEEKVRKILRLHERLTEAKIIWDQEHGSYVMEAHVAAPRHHSFNARAEATDLRAATDSIEAKLEAQIRHWKDKMTHHRG